MHIYIISINIGSFRLAKINSCCYYQSAFRIPVSAVSRKGFQHLTNSGAGHHPEDIYERRLER